MSSSEQSVMHASVKIAAPRWVYFAIFAISGFSGLIYESIWSHYLKLFLGHAAYAQSLVLIIFMGGMAAGSWLASRWSSKMRIPILAYAAVEAVVGVVALVFHDLFAGLIDVFHATVLPSVGSPAIGILSKWLAASLLILPQSILLGMTFPLMSSGIIRRFPDTPGGSIAMLYFTNSIGAALGVLASGFLLIANFGLPGTIMTAGLLNIALALVVWSLVKLDPVPETAPIEVRDTGAKSDRLAGLFLLAAFITGAASFIYEISWIRMLSLVLGATTHSFEIMLSAFITGLAFGGLWIKRRIDNVQDPVRFSGYVQLIMGVFALLTIPIYILTYDWMVWLRSVLQETEAAFGMYALASHGISLAVMLPTTFMAGMTLPLFTYVLLRRGLGEASIGRIYASNTVGAIVGVLFAVHIGMPTFGLKNLIVFGALLDIVLGVYLLYRSAAGVRTDFRFVTVTSVVLIVLGTTTLAVNFDQHLLASGVYRYKNTETAAKDDIIFYKDGKTASVSFRHNPYGLGVLATNGKPDASIQLREDDVPSSDELTMILAAALPIAYVPNARYVANIGMGSGQTAHVVLGDPDVERLDTIEIEVEMVNASRNFGSAVERAYEDPRSHIHIEDAKTFFSLNQRVYDIIIAEPSNPWVSGVSSLFSDEFYGTVIDYLDDDGVFVQWIQSYEFTDELAISILKALSKHFTDYSIYLSNSSDIILIATKEGQLRQPDWSKVLGGAIGESLARLDINNASDLMIRRSVDRDILVPYLEDLSVPINSDYFPYVDLNAGKAMFMDEQARMFRGWMLAESPMLEMLTGNDPVYQDVTPEQFPHRASAVDVANWIYDKMTRTKVADPDPILAEFPPQVAYGADWLAASQQSCMAEANPKRWFEAAYDVLSYSLPNLDPQRAETLVDEVAAAACGLTDGSDVQAQLELYRAVALRDAEAMFALAYAQIDGEAAADVYWKGYLVNSAMLGSVAAGRPRDAYEIWTQHGAEHYSDRPLPDFMKLVLSLSARFDDDASTRVAAD